MRNNQCGHLSVMQIRIADQMCQGGINRILDMYGLGDLYIKYHKCRFSWLTAVLYSIKLKVDISVCLSVWVGGHGCFKSDPIRTKFDMELHNVTGEDPGSNYLNHPMGQIQGVKARFRWVETCVVVTCIDRFKPNWYKPSKYHWGGVSRVTYVWSPDGEKN
jgi:hypothetical protein